MITEKATEIITYEDAIKWFEGQRVPIKKQGSLDSAIYNFTVNSMIDVAVLALEKQIPKKPYKIKEHKQNDYYCTVCKRYLGDEMELKYD